MTDTPAPRPSEPTGICPDGLGQCDRGCGQNCARAMERDGLVAPLASKQQLQEAAQCADWGQVVANGGPPCFHLELGRFCLRAWRWPGHNNEHTFVGLEELLRGTVETTEQRGPVDTLRLRACIERLVSAEAALMEAPEPWPDYVQKALDIIDGTAVSEDGQ